MTTKKPRLPKSMRKTDVTVSREREIMRAVSDLEISIGMAFKLFRNRVSNIFDPGSVPDAAAVAPPDPNSTEIDPRFFESTLARDAPPPRGRRRGHAKSTNGSSVVDALYQATAPVAANHADLRDLPPLGVYARKILGVLVQFMKPCSTTFVAIVLGRSESGSFDTAVAELRRHGCVEGDRSALRAVRDRIPPDLVVPKLPIGTALLDMWIGKLGPCPGAILGTLYNAHPKTMHVEEVAATSRNPRGEPYSVSGSFDTHVATLRKLELIEGKSSALGLHPVFVEAIGDLGARR